MLIKIDKLNYDYLLCFKYVATYKNILILSDGNLDKKEKGSFFRKCNILLRALRIFQLYRETPNVFFNIDESFIFASSKKNKIRAEIVYDNSIKREFNVVNFGITSNYVALSFDSYASLFNEKTFLDKLDIKSNVNENFILTIWDKSKIKIRFTE